MLLPPIYGSHPPAAAAARVFWSCRLCRGTLGISKPPLGAPHPQLPASAVQSFLVQVQAASPQLGVAPLDSEMVCLQLPLKAPRAARTQLPPARPNRRT